MSFLNQLKSQAKALQSVHGEQQQNLAENTASTEAACRVALQYLEDLARQLNVISPAAPRFSLDGKTAWPAMKLTSFRVDARKKMLRDREVFEYIGMGWQVVPQMGAAVGGVVSVNFPPDLHRVETNLALGQVKHERREIRHPEKNSLQAIRFEYLTETRGSVAITADHDAATLAFRLVNASGFGLVNTVWPVAKLQSDMLDELAKLIVSQPSRFC